MNILFIGGSGNISYACVAEMVRREHKVTVVTRGVRECPAGCETIVADADNVDALRTQLAGRTFDATVDFLIYRPEQVTRRLDALTDRCGPFIFISSATVYEKPPRALPITEETPLGNPWSPYAQAKQACETALDEEATRRQRAYTIIRPSHTYSEQWMPNPISSAGYTLAARLLAGKPVIVPDDGQGLWTLTASSDFAVGLAGLAGDPATFGEVYHITSDQALTWNAIICEAARAVGVDQPTIVPIPTDFICEADPAMVQGLKGDKSHHAVFDNAKIKARVPDFECRVTVRDGMRAAAAWFAAHPARQVVNPEVDARYDRILQAWGGGNEMG